MTLQRSVRCLYDRMQLITRVFPQGIHAPFTQNHHRSIFTHTPQTILTSNSKLSTRLMSTTDEFVSAAAADIDHSDHTAAFSCLRLRGIPFDISPSDIPPFLGLNVVDVLLDRTRTGRLSGEAYIVLKDPSEAEAAIQKNNQYLGGRYIEVFGSNKEEYYKAVVNTYMAMSRGSDNYNNNNNNNNNNDWSSSSSSNNTNNSYGNNNNNNRRGTATSPIVKLRGLPFEATSEDIAMFFNSDNQLGLDSPIDESHIYMPLTRSGRPSGVAYVAFNNVDDATKSFKKHRQHIGRRYVEIYPSDEEERSREQEMFG